MTVSHGIGLRDHTVLTGGSEFQDGAETAISEATGYGFENCEEIRQDTAYRPDAAGTDPDSTRFLYRLASRQETGAVALAGLEELTGKDAAVRIRRDNRVMEKTAIGLVTGDSPSTIAETAGWTFTAWFRVDGSKFPISSSDERLIIEVRQGGSSTNATRLVRMAMTGSAGNLRTRVERLGGSDQTTDHASSSVTDGAPHICEITCTDAGGSGATIRTYFDGALIKTETIATVFGTNTLLNVSTGIGIAIIGQAALYSVALSADELDALRARTLTGAEGGLVAGYNMDENTGTTAGDITGTYDMTLSAGTWTLIQNPVALHSPTAAPRWQAWRRRNLLACVASGAGVVWASGTSLSTSAVVHVMGWIRLPRLPPASTQVLLNFGASQALTNFDWQVRLTSAGLLTLRANRFDAGSAETEITATTSLSDGVDRRFSFRISWAGAMSLAIDGTEEATGTAPAYTANSSSRVVLHAGNVDMDIGGPVVVSRRAYTHAEADAILLGTAPLIPTQSTEPEAYLLYHLNEVSGTAIANRGAAGSAGDLVITGSSAAWDVDALDNPSPGAARGPMSERVAQMFWEMDPGVSHDTLEILVELYDPEATTLTLYHFFLFEAIWPEVGSSAGADDSVGPALDYSAYGVARSDPGDSGRDVSMTFPRLSIEDGENLKHHVREARRTRRGGATVPMRPIGLIYAAADRTHWPNCCAVIIPELPHEALDGSQSAEWERALALSGREIRYGSDV